MTAEIKSIFSPASLTIGDAIKRGLKRTGHTQQFLADELGFSRQTLHKLIVGKRKLEPEWADVLSDLFEGTPEEWMLCAKGSFVSMVAELSRDYPIFSHEIRERWADIRIENFRSERLYDSRYELTIDQDCLILASSSELAPGKRSEFICKQSIFLPTDVFADIEVHQDLEKMGVDLGEIDGVLTAEDSGSLRGWIQNDSHQAIELNKEIPIANARFYSRHAK